ncbi:signal peptidase I [Aeromicrobium sp. Leaf350]|uniref:signal peptidase I n=1 Tax=Aeromicrobium sp. Leaf350 TaxID=2876565 RepID=UPI001E4DF43F|nr:signal peptidase I [Aeromicrobium sp. Leaf350]
MATSKEHRQRRGLPIWQESLLLVAIATVMAIVVKSFFLQAFYIPSESMQPTLLVNDKLLVQKVSLWTGEPERGDIVVFDDPGGWLAGQVEPSDPNFVQKGLETIGLFPTGNHLIKRVIGVGGDHVQCCDGSGRLIVNGQPIDEPYVLDPTVIRNREFDVVVKDGYLWVMGDNRDNSADSVAHLGDPGGGQVQVDDVVGIAWVRVWPLNRLGGLGDVDAFDDVPDSPPS